MAKDGMRQRSPLRLGGGMFREVGLNQQPGLPGEQDRTKVKNDIHQNGLLKND
jgi:hypothetical protein